MAHQWHEAACQNFWLQLAPTAGNLLKLREEKVRVHTELGGSQAAAHSEAGPAGDYTRQRGLCTTCKDGRPGLHIGSMVQTVGPWTWHIKVDICWTQLLGPHTGHSRALDDESGVMVVVACELSSQAVAGKFQRPRSQHLLPLSGIHTHQGRGMIFN